MRRAARLPDGDRQIVDEMLAWLRDNVRPGEARDSVFWHRKAAQWVAWAARATDDEFRWRLGDWADTYRMRARESEHAEQLARTRGEGPWSRSA